MPQSAVPQSAVPQSSADDLPEWRTPHGSSLDSQELPRRETTLPLPSESPTEGAESLPKRSAPPSEGSESLPERSAPPSEGNESLPKRGGEQGGDLPQRGAELPQRGAELPRRGADLPQRGADLPQRGAELPQRGAELPRRGADLPQRGADLPQRGADLPQRGADLPQRGETADPVGALPRRTTRTRPSGRHRSPHRLSVASDAPALVLAVPGRAEADISEIGQRVASIAGLSCPGVDIRVGYIEGDDLLVAECLLPSGPEQR